MQSKTKKIWVAISKLVKSQVCRGIFVCIIENRSCLKNVSVCNSTETHEVDISDVSGLLHSFSDNFITTLIVRRSCSVSRTSISETGQTFIHPLIHRLGTPNEAFFH